MAAEEEEFEETTAIFTADSFDQAKSGMRRSHVLIRMDGSEIGKVIRLRGERQFVIGRRGDCDLVINVEGVSRRHARLIFDGNVFVVEDLNSANGVTIDGERVAQHRLADGEVLQLGPFVSVRYSITDPHEEQMLRKLYDAAVRDSLTGAFNREYLSHRLQSEVALAKRHGGSTSLLLFDLDHFKRVNDSFGHLAGDAVLLDVVRTVNSTLRAEDVLARYGGEEFAVSMRNVDLLGARTLGERIRKCTHRAVHFQGHQIPISVSVGCASLADCSPRTADTLIAVADRRLYAAKHAGRNRVIAAD